MLFFLFKTSGLIGLGSIGRHAIQWGVPPGFPRGGAGRIWGGETGGKKGGVEGGSGKGGGGGGACGGGGGGRGPPGEPSFIHPGTVPGALTALFPVID